jgi:lipid-A-disaccharide synthase-like uncharacterized protein
MFPCLCFVPESLSDWTLIAPLGKLIIFDSQMRVQWILSEGNLPSAEPLEYRW